MLDLDTLRPQFEDVGPPTSPPRKNMTTESIALIANNGGSGIILELHGTGISCEVDAVGSKRLDDYGLDDAPDGLSIWEGHLNAHPCGPHNEEVDTGLVGKFRDLTDEEWRLLKETGVPWEIILPAL